MRFLPTPWPADKLPPPTATLLSISSSKKLVAAAGPESLVIASTDSVRQAFRAEGPAEDNVKGFTPQLTIPIPRVSQVAFSSDGTYLIICAENGGGLAVYETQSLMQGKAESAFQLATNGIAVRALAPNPNPSSETAHRVAVVLEQGQLMEADLKTQQFQQGQNGPVLREGVSCVSWSRLGKQVVAGLGDGTAVQLAVQEVKATIPRPPELQGNLFVSRVLWLETDEFIIVHTPVGLGSDDRAPDSVFHYVSRDKGTQNYTFRQLNDPCSPFGLKRAPQYHFISRLRAFPPGLTDLLIVASTASPDIGLFSRVTTALSSEAPQTANEFTVTGLEEDSRRAMLPPNDMIETSPIGMSLDFSSEEKVVRPIPGDEMDESPMPLPELMVLNNDGMLCAWWIVYNDSLRQNQPYPELNAVGGQAATVASPPRSTPFGGSSSMSQPQSTPSAFARPAGATFGSSTFGSAPTGAFGGTSALGMSRSPWASATTSSPQASGATFGRASTQPVFGASTFGSASPVAGGGAFATAGKSLWGAPASTSDSSTPQTKPANPFSAGTVTTASPFASFATPKQGAAASPFSAFGGDKAASSPFASVPSTSGASFGMRTEPSFGSTVTIDSSTGGSTLGGQSLFGASKDNSFGTPAQPSTSIFGQKPAATSAPAPAPAQETEMGDADDQMGDEPAKPAEPKTKAAFGRAEGFKLGSTFKPGDPDKEDEAEEPKKAQPTKTSLFGNGFGDALTATQKPTEPITPIKKEPGTDEPNLQNISTTPATQPKAAAPGDTSTIALPTVPESPRTKSQTPHGSDESGPVVGSSPEEVQAPSSPLSPSASEGEEPVDEAPLPPDPSTVKKPQWFYDQPPGSSTTPAKPSGTFETPPAAAKAAEPLRPPPTQVQHDSTTPAGFPKSTAFFPPPAAKAQDSPRSPSPVRSATMPARRGTPGLGSQSLSRPPVQFAQASQAPPTSIPTKQPPQPQPQVASPPEPAVIPTAADLADADADRVRAILASPIEPSQYLKPFEAQQRYAKPITDSSADPALTAARNIEEVYRDVNDMVDTVGMNNRHLAEWIAWNQQSTSGGAQRERRDLRGWLENMDTEEEEQWALVEIEDLQYLVKEIDEDLEDGKIKDKRQKIEELSAQSRDLDSLRKKVVEVRKWIEASGNEEKIRKRRGEELPADAARLQADIRLKMAEFKKLLAEAEDGVLMIKAKLAKGKDAPTVEAVTSTVQKVTAIAQQKSADVDVLEMQMRKLGLVNESSSASQILGSSMRSSAVYSSPRRGRGAPSSREGTPFATPTTPGSMTRSRMSRMFETSSVDSTPLRRRTRSLGGQSSVVLANGDDEVRKLIAAKKKRMMVKEALRNGLIKRAEGAR